MQRVHIADSDRMSYFMKLLNVSIVTYKTDDEELQTCIASIKGCDCLNTIIVVDNSSSKNTADLCRNLNVEYIANANTGYGAAHNIALRKSLEQGVLFHLVLNSDVIVLPHVLKEVVEYMQKHADVVQLIPHTIFPDGREQSVCHPLPTPFDLIMRRFLPASWFESRRRRYNLEMLSKTDVSNVPYHHGCFMLMRTDALRKSGLFDERFFMYPEDIDLTRRLHREGKTIYYPHATIVHAHRAASKTSMRMLKIHIVNMCRYFNKWGWLFDKERRSVNKRLFEAINIRQL